MRCAPRRYRLHIMSENKKQGREQRKDERINTTLPVNLDGVSGLTRNVSASGIFFETDVAYAPNSTINFVVALDTSSGKMLLKCHGEIVRVEPHGQRVGVAVRVIESTMAASHEQKTA